MNALDTIRREPTLTGTLLHGNAGDLALFKLHETGLDLDDFFAAQMKRPCHAEYEARLPALLRKPRTMQVFEPLRSDYVFRMGMGRGPA